MTVKNPKTQQKRLNSYVLQIPKWAKPAKNGQLDTTNPLRTAVSGNVGTLRLENDSRFDQTRLNTTSLGKYRLNPVSLCRTK